VSRRAGRLDLSALAVAAWALLSLGSAVRYGTYTPLAVTLVTAGVLALTVVVLLLAEVGVRAPTRGSLVAGCTVALVSTVLSPAERYARGSAETISHGFLIVAAALLVVLAARPQRVRGADRAIHAAVVLAATVAGVFGIRAYPRPTIDDWHILQGSAHALGHLHNIYGHAWPGAEGHLLPYLPASAALPMPFYLVFGDVRYGLLAALVLAAVAVAALGGARRTASLSPSVRATVPTAVLVLSGMVLVYPWVLYGIEQSWPEPLLLALIAAMVLAVQRGRTGVAIACLALALLTKQHVVLVLPFAAVWPAFGWRRTVGAAAIAAAVLAPWVVVDPQSFWHGAVSYNLTLPPRHDSLSLFAASIRAGHTPTFLLVPAGVALALAVGLWRLPRSAPGFVYGSAWLLAVFNLLNKQSFFNEWSFVLGLIVLGLATTALPRRD
jgi:hypothetical protein